MGPLPIPRLKYTVLVRCNTFNQSNYIEDTLNGFVMQQTTFPYVCLIIDDASTDGEQQLIKSFLEKECDMSKVIRYDTEPAKILIVPHRANQHCTMAVYLLRKNHYSIKRSKIPYVKPWVDCCNYEAFCEGDDYWIDPLKLQKQVDFLESHQDYVVCSHDFIRLNQNNKELQKKSAFHYLFTSKKDNKDFFTYTLDDYFKGWWTHPLTCMYRNRNFYENIPREKYKSFRDDIFYYYVLKEGKGALLPDVMAVYRIHNAGVWSKSNYIEKKEASMFNAYNIYTVEHDKRAFGKILRIQSEVLIHLWKTGNKQDFYQKLKDYFKLDPSPYAFKLVWKLIVNLMVEFKHKLTNPVK